MSRPVRRGARAILLLALWAGAAGGGSCAPLEPAGEIDARVGRYLSRHGAATAPATRPASAPASQPAGPLELTIQEAVLLALENNPSLAVERLAPSIRRTFEQEQRAEFDPVLTASASGSGERETAAGGARERSAGASVSAGVTQRLPAGADLTVGVDGRLETSSLRDDRYQTRLGLTINQALLRGAGADVNLVAVRQARLDTLASQYELRGVAQALVAETEQVYWDYVLALRTIEIVTSSMALAEQQVRETRERIAVGRLAETELAAAEAELARRREDLINAKSTTATLRLRLLRLLSPAAEDPWSREVAPRSPPLVPDLQLDAVDVYVALALRMRPELNQARLGIKRDDLELVRTRNGLLPKLDLFVTLGKSGYAETFGGSFGAWASEDYDLLVGVRGEYPLGNRAAQARHSRALYTREQAALALENLAQLAQVDVRTAYIEVQRALEQVTATAATRRLREETLRVEAEKYRVGKSTSFLVAQAQRDLLDSQIAEVQAATTYLKALTSLHLQSGTLLERRGVSAPGAEPVEP